MISLPVFITFIIIFIIGLIIGYFTAAGRFRGALHLAEAEREEIRTRSAAEKVDAVEVAVAAARTAQRQADKEQCDKDKDEAEKAYQDAQRYWQYWDRLRCCRTGETPTGCESTDSARPGR